MRWLLIGFIKGWRRVISPLYGDVCRYYPTCSAYGLRAVEFHGAWKGSWLTMRRIASCHPWAEGGVQFVPGTPEEAAWQAELARRTRAAEAAGRTPDGERPQAASIQPTDDQPIPAGPASPADPVAAGRASYVGQPRFADAVASTPSFLPSPAEPARPTGVPRP